MKTRYIILTAILTMAVSACKNDQTTTETKDAVAKVEAKENFSVEVDVMVEKDDNFAVYFTEDGTINFNGDNAAWSGVKGGNQSQKVVFDLSEAVLPTHVRLDFGINKEQGNVTVQNIKMMYYGKSFDIKGSEFLKYFIQNDSIQTKVDDANGTITFLKNPKNFNIPFYYPHQALLDEIGKITQ